MKIRSGFVSNSSSSSFIVGFPTIPRSVEEMKAFLFKEDQDYYPSPFDTDMIWSVDEVAQTVFDDMKNQIPLTTQEVFSLSEGLVHLDWNDKRFEKKEYNEKLGREVVVADWEAQRKEEERLSKEEAEKFLDENQENYFFVFKYADENGSYGAALEHGDLFYRLPHITINEH